MKKFDLPACRQGREDRSIDFTIRISNVVDEIDNSKLGTHIAGQLIRSGSSPALNYGEAQSAVRQLADCSQTENNSKRVKRKSNLLKNYRKKTINPKYKEINSNYERNGRVNSYNL